MESLPPSKRRKSEVNSLKCIVCQEDTLSKTICMFAAPMQPEAYSEPCETSKMELFLKIVNSF